MSSKKRHLLGVVYRKELLDSLRDRRALVSMIVVPLVFIPLLILGMGGLSYAVGERVEAEVYSVMILGAENAEETAAALDEVESLKVVPQTENFREAIGERKLAAAVEFPLDFSERLEAEEPVAVVIYTYEGEMRSALAARRLEGFFRERGTGIVAERLAAVGLPEEAIRPFAVSRQNVAAPEKVTGAFLGRLLPYMLIVLCITGAVYPAMDLTAGEKERGTMETLLCSPVSRVTLVLGKFFVILTFSVTTSLLAVGALGVTGWVALSQIQEGAAALDLAISPLAIGGTFFLLLPVAALFSAILLALSVFARTFKEAQTYVSPLILVALLPSVVALMPGVEITPVLALVPVLNVSLISREVLSGVYPWGYIALVLSSSTIYATAALLVAVRLFQQERVIFRA